MKTLMEQEIFSQKNVLDNTLAANADVIAKLGELVRTNKPSHIIMVARGSSDNACMYFKYMCEVYCGIPVVFFHPSVITLYNSNYDFANSIVIGVSQSGKALDVLTVMQQAEKCGAPTVAVTNFVDSPMALNADYHLFLNVGEEKSVAATKTFSAQMFVLGMLVYAISGKSFDKTAEQIDDVIGKVLDNPTQIIKVADKFVNVDQAIILARGINLCIANELALKFQETCYINARSYAISDFHHGPFALANPKMHFIIIAMDDVTKKDAVEMVEKLRPTGSDVTIVTDDEEVAKLSGSSIVIPKCEDATAPFATVVAGQLLVCNLSGRRGINPDSPRGLNKVTITK